MLGMGDRKILQQTKNKRYRLLVSENKNYLLDSDSNKFVWIVPWLIWFFPFKAYEVKDTADLFEEKKGNKGRLVLLVSVFTALMIRMLPTEMYTDKPFPQNEFLLSLLIIVFSSVILFLRSLVSKKNKYDGKISKTVNIKLNFLSFFRSNFKFILFFSIGTVISILLLLELFRLFINGGNLLSLIGFLLIYTFLLFTNQTIKAPEAFELLIEE